MKQRILLSRLIIVCSLIGVGIASDWPQWRGPEGTGVAPGATPPIEWSEDSNVAWKVELPGKGTSTPIIWGDRLFLTAAVPIKTDQAGETDEADRAAARQGRGTFSPHRQSRRTSRQRFEVLAFNRHDGRLLWRQTALEGTPHERTHQDGNWAPGSPVTDGKHLFVSFGSQGIYSFDLDGKLVWSTDLGDMRIRHSFGEGSSPALYGDILVINWDHEGQSFLTALDKSNGRELWRTPRDEPTSWTTPLIVEVDGRPQVIVSATNRVRGYDLKSGQELWQSAGMTVNAIPTPVHSQGLVFVTSGFRGNALQAIDLKKARGDIADTEALAWTYDRDTPYVPSPLLVSGRLYLLKRNSAILTCFDAKSGRKIYGPKRLEGMQGAYASPVAAAGRVYVAGRAGTVTILEDGESFRVKAVNHLDDGFDASPAIVGDAIYLRGRTSLYCLKEQ